LNHNNKPVEHSDPTFPRNFEFHVCEAEDEDDDEEIPYEITRLLEQERRAIQPHIEEIELVNLGTEENKREIKIGAALKPEVKKKIIQLLRDYPDVFAWSYEDMPGLDPKIVEHQIPTRPECPPVK
jgi:hypothetical protein